MVDIAHIAGLVVAGEHPSPFPYADVVTTTTHKTLRGPRGGMILSNDEEIAKKINKAIFPGTQGGPLMHVIAGKAVAFKEALSDDFKKYQHQVILNARAMADEFTAQDIDMVSGGTDNHLMLIKLVKNGVTGKELEHLLDDCHITVNKNAIPNDPQKPFVTSGIRVGVPAATSRGMKEPEMRTIAKLISKVIKEKEAALADVSAAVAELCSRFPLYPDLG